MNFNEQEQGCTFQQHLNGVDPDMEADKDFKHEVKKLSCGCKRGSYLCPTAELLWKTSDALYRAGLRGLSKMYRSYYEAHFENPEASYLELIGENHEE